MSAHKPHRRLSQTPATNHQHHQSQRRRPAYAKAVQHQPPRAALRNVARHGPGSQRARCAAGGRWSRIGAGARVDLPARAQRLAHQRSAQCRHHGDGQRTRSPHADGAAAPWLFPGGQTGRPISTYQLAERLHRVGIRPAQARSTALFSLAAELPAAILARLLGIRLREGQQHLRPRGPRAATASASRWWSSSFDRRTPPRSGRSPCRSLSRRRGSRRWRAGRRSGRGHGPGPSAGAGVRV